MGTRTCTQGRQQSSKSQFSKWKKKAKKSAGKTCFHGITDNCWFLICIEITAPKPKLHMPDSCQKENNSTWKSHSIAVKKLHSLQSQTLRTVAKKAGYSSTMYLPGKQREGKGRGIGTIICMPPLFPWKRHLTETFCGYIPYAEKLETTSTLYSSPILLFYKLLVVRSYKRLGKETTQTMQTDSEQFRLVFQSHASSPQLQVKWSLSHSFRMHHWHAVITMAHSKQVNPGF